MSERQSRAQREEPESSAARFSFAEWSLRRKLAALLAIPVLLAALFAGLRINDSLDNYRSYSKAVEQAKVLQPSLDFMVASENLAEAVASPTDNAKLRPAQQAYDTTSKALADSLDDHDLTTEQISGLNRAIAAGNALRNSTAALPAESVSDRISTIADGVSGLSTSISRGQPDAALDSIPAVVSGRQALADQRVLVASRGGGNLTASARATLSGAVGREAGAIRDLSNAFGTTNEQIVRLNDNASSRLTASASPTGDTTLIGTDTSLNSYVTLSDDLIHRAATNLGDGASNARGDAIRDSLVTLAALLAALVLALVVARMLLEPIRRVRSGALEVAHQRLPEAIERIHQGQEISQDIRPIPVRTHEEMGQMARAVDDMHRQALRLATEQARLRTQVGSMFETLSRRSTSLVNQQLGLIESLERDEDDPQRLESLFKLDHLATRMRRNGDSLLVLSGASSRSGTAQDLPITDVLRGALSEVQDYQRVELESIPEHLVRAAAGSDMIHLFAELIDNALAYSPSTTQVVLRGARAGEGGVLVEVEDSGLGMDADTMADINLSLEAGAEVTPDTARHMGLFVVSRLAESHDVTVDLRKSKTGGVVASVALPSGILVQRERREVTGPIELREQADRSQGGSHSLSSVPDPAESSSYDDAPTTTMTLASSNGTRTGATSASAASGSFGVTAPPAADDREPVDRDPTLTALPSGLPKRRPGATGAGQMGSLDMLRPVPGPHLDGPSRDTGRSTSYDDDDTSSFLPRNPDSAASTSTDSSNGFETTSFDSTAFDSDLDSRSSTSYDDLLSTAGGASSFSDLLHPNGSGDDATSEWKPTWTPSEDTFSGTDVWTPLSDEPLLPEADSSAERVAPTNASAFFSARSEVRGGLTDDPYDFTSPAPTADPFGLGSTSETTTSEVAAPSEPADPFDIDTSAEPVDEADTPIFGSMQSQWLSDETSTDLPWASSQVEAGWEAADRATSIGTVTHTESGLPKRRPGEFLVPGAVTPPKDSFGDRDPAEIRDRLSRHLSGVHRGRTALRDGTLGDDPSGSPEETGRA
ncbi:ATP-binding protein [Luteipulveratus halotolerans]|uniref:histidine kinase n=1 Tax=Luteipulveratus halotolerans TaxID=1631356 RepID=A0A0L6CLP7_9MICO|nr:ATP-binding protein [Luteipulveratus halotolerans]KNX38560.1 hypothetical protein VV01_17660 [Luteipulveratus halotolerans]